MPAPVPRTISLRPSLARPRGEGAAHGTAASALGPEAFGKKGGAEKMGVGPVRLVPKGAPCW